MNILRCYIFCFGSFVFIFLLNIFRHILWLFWHIIFFRCIFLFILFFLLVYLYILYSGIFYGRFDIFRYILWSFWYIIFSDIFSISFRLFCWYIYTYLVPAFLMVAPTYGIYRYNFYIFIFRNISKGTALT